MTIDSKALEAGKALATDFFRWWWNTPGTNTDQGFDEWAAGPGAAAITAYLAALPPPKVEGESPTVKALCSMMDDLRHARDVDRFMDPRKFSPMLDTLLDAAIKLEKFERLARSPSPVLADEGVTAKAMTINLSAKEIEVLEALAKKQDLSPVAVIRQGLRHYQLLVEGEPDLGQMLPPAVTP